MFEHKSTNKPDAVQQKKGQTAIPNNKGLKKSAAPTIAVYGTSTIVGKAKAN